MVNVEDIYIAFQKAKSQNRPYRIPKNWDKVWVKLTEYQVKQLELINVAFNTRWQNIDIDKYFQCGVELFGSGFTYSKFYDKRILTLYIEKDKQIKRSQGNIKVAYENGEEYIKEWMNERPHREDMSLYKQYCMMNDNGIKAPIRHYMSNKIDKYMLTWLINRKYLQLADHEKIMIPLVIENYWKYAEEINGVIGIE